MLPFPMLCRPFLHMIPRKTFYHRICTTVTHQTMRLDQNKHVQIRRHLISLITIHTEVTTRCSCVPITFIQRSSNLLDVLVHQIMKASWRRPSRAGGSSHGQLLTSQDTITLALPSNNTRHNSRPSAYPSSNDFLSVVEIAH